MRALARLAQAAVVTGAVAGTIHGARYWSTARRITWAPGAGEHHDGILHVRVYGTGSDGVLLLHGLGGSNAYWGAAYDHVAGPGRLVVPDLLGFGASPRPDVNYDADDHAAALIDTLDDHGVTSPVVIGAHSVGCLVALALARRHPNRVSGIVAICPPLYEDADHARDRIARLGWIEHQIAYDTPSAATACRLVCDHREAAAALTVLARPGMPAAIRRGGVQHTWASYEGTFRNLLTAANPDQWFSDVRCPVALIAGSRDGITDLDHLSALANHHPQVTLDVQADADHCLPLTHPAVCADAIVRARAVAPTGTQV